MSAEDAESAGKKSTGRTAAAGPAVNLAGAVAAKMPTSIQPMLSVSAEKPFDSLEWLFEIKWDGYRAIAFINDGKLRLVSRNQNDLTLQFSELRELPNFIKARTAILDGEIVALDETGRSSFSLMQQRTGIRKGGHRVAGRSDLQTLYYAFDLIYLDGFDLHRVVLEERKRALAGIISTSGVLRYSDHFDHGLDLFEAAKQQGLEGILAKARSSLYEERRSREWRKIKITRTVDCVIGGYTEPEGSREYFGSMVLGLYDEQKQLIHVGQAGTGFDRKALQQIWQVLNKLETGRSPFHGEVDAKRVHWIRPERVAEIKFSEWTHESAEGGQKLRAPVFVGLREDKTPEECTFADQAPV